MTMADDAAYRKAEKKIEQARQHRATELDLSCDYKAEDSEKLTELPESLGRFTQLQTLNLENNQLTALPESLGQLTQLQTLNLNGNQLTALPESLGQLTQLQTLNLNGNQLTALPESLGQLTQLQTLHLNENQLTTLPEFVRGFEKLVSLRLWNNILTSLPEWIGELTELRGFSVFGNELISLPASIGQLSKLREFSCRDNQLSQLPEAIGQLHNLTKLWAYNNNLSMLPASIGSLDSLVELNVEGNPLDPELAAAYEQGLDAVKEYLRAKAKDAVVLNEAKLILIGEGEVGKSCLLDALRDEPWQKHVSTHGIEIKPVVVTHRDDDGAETDITLNTWDFGGQKVYRPTHQLFFSAPAVYLVVWKPREGPQQGAVEYWINTIKHRAGPDAKVLVVATHGGPQQRQPDIDLQDLRDKFGADCVLGSFHVDNRPPNHDEATDTHRTWSGQRKGMAELKHEIANVAAALPNLGREVATSWSKVLSAVRQRSENDPYISYADFQELCKDQDVVDALAKTYAGMLNELGYVIHYGADDDLKEIMILKPDWLAKAISFVLDDKETRKRHGLVSHDHLSQLWSHPPYEDEEGYPEELHSLFRRLMERFDLSYQVVLDPASRKPISTSLIAQLVDDQPLLLPDWGESAQEDDEEKRQVCQIVERDKNQSANAEGLFYRLIARLHKYSLGRDDYAKSVHWQRGLMLEDRYNGRAVLKHVGNDVHITVRAAYPDFLLYELTKEVKWLVENPDEGWAGLRCDVMVPCIEPCGLNQSGRGMFEVGKLKESKRRGRDEYPCDVAGCDEWQNIDCLLQNATVTRRASRSEAEVEVIRQTVTSAVRTELQAKDQKDLHRFRFLTSEIRRAMSQADEHFQDLIQTLTDEAKEGPRLFSFEPVDRSRFNPKRFASDKFRLTLWCEHSRLPLTHPDLSGGNEKKGVYEVELTRDWIKKSAPFLKVLSSTLSLALPIASSATKLAMDATAYEAIENQLDFGKTCAESFLEAGEKVGDWLTSDEDTEIESGRVRLAQSAELRQLHALLKEKDPGFGGLERVQNKRREFLWVHPQFADEY